MVVVDPDALRGQLLAGWLSARHALVSRALCHTLADAQTSIVGIRPALVVIAPELPDGDGLRLLQDGFAPRAVAIIVEGRRDVGPRRFPEGPNVTVVERGIGPARVAAALDGIIRDAGIATPAVLVETRLSPRERDVLLLMGEGLQSTAIAARLVMSRLTVETHRKSIARKLGVTGAGLVRRAALQLATNWTASGAADRSPATASR